MNLSMFALALATTTGVIAATPPATAQTAQQRARFEQAQERYDRETDLYRREVDRYRAAGGDVDDDPRYPEGSFREPYAQSDPRAPYASPDARDPYGSPNPRDPYAAPNSRDPYAAPNAGYSYDNSGRRVAPDIYGNGSYRNGPVDNDDRNEGNYDPSRYYRPGRETVLSANDRVYAGQNGQYYCKRSDGTTGLIVGAAGGGILGNIIDGGHSRTVGTLLGAAVGGLAGRAVDRGNTDVRCR